MMWSPISAALAAMLLLLGGARGHMVMNTPPSYNLAIAPFLQVNPISGDLYPFPCHSQYGFTSRTLVEAGAATLVNFTGGAQHDGGSCQFSISYDEPTDGENWNKSATFKTIYTIIGGCPAVFSDETRNLPLTALDANKGLDAKHCGNDHGVDCIRQFMIPVPKFLKNGPATFAWTWFNKLGNKEMYMNCAPVNITGGTGDQKQIDELPNIFVANYPNDPDVPNCITGTDKDKVVVNVPNPGKYGRVLEAPLEPMTKPASYCTQIPPASLVPTFESIMAGRASTSSPSVTGINHQPQSSGDNNGNPVTTRPPLTKTPPPLPSFPSITSSTSTCVDLTAPAILNLLLAASTSSPGINFGQPQSSGDNNGTPTTRPPLTKTPPPLPSFPSITSSTFTSVYLSAANMLNLRSADGTKSSTPSINLGQPQSSGDNNGTPTTRPPLTKTPPPLPSFPSITSSTFTSLYLSGLNMRNNLPAAGATSSSTSIIFGQPQSSGDNNGTPITSRPPLTKTPPPLPPTPNMINKLPAAGTTTSTAGINFGQPQSSGDNNGTPITSRPPLTKTPPPFPTTSSASNKA